MCAVGRDRDLWEKSRLESLRYPHLFDKTIENRLILFGFHWGKFDDIIDPLVFTQPDALVLYERFDEFVAVDHLRLAVVLLDDEVALLEFESGIEIFDRECHGGGVVGEVVIHLFARFFDEVGGADTQTALQFVVVEFIVESVATKQYAITCLEIVLKVVGLNLRFESYRFVEDVIHPFAIDIVIG